MYVPIKIENYYIYDIYHNDNDNLIIISPSERSPLSIKYKDSIFTVHICPHKHTYIYVLKEKIEYKEKIVLTINGKNIETKVNKYPEFKDEIIMSTIVYREDDYIRQWIEFHKNIGIKRFIIYDNSTDYTLETLLKDFIDRNIVILIKWNYKYLMQISGISGQTTQQNHSIWAFQNCKYIGLFDIDEYVNIQNNTDINHFLDSLIKSKNINIDEIGSLRVLNKFFYNPDNLPTDSFNFLKIYNCDEITLSGHEKNFVIPKNVNTFSVHMITNGKKMYTVPYSDLYFNHYYFLNKTDRGKKQTKIIDKSISKHTTGFL